ncbi:unnamed protein product, partial [Owenia fusiformis]
VYYDGGYINSLQHFYPLSPYDHQYTRRRRLFQQKETLRTKMYLPVIVALLLTGVFAELCPDNDSPFKLNLDLPLPMREKTWLLAVDGDWFPYSYLSNQTGQALGLVQELVYEACTRCNMRCKTIYLANDGKTCWDPVGPPPLHSEGLFNRHFDGCLGWGATLFRENVLKFSAPFLEPKRGRFYTRTTSDIKSLSDLVPGKKVGFVDGHYLDVYCGRAILKSQGNSQLAGADILKYPTSFTDVLQKLKVTKELDVAFLPEYQEGTEDLLVLGGVHNCTTSGLGIMHRKDVDFSWFGKCLAEVERVGRYKVLCDRYNSQRCLRVAP